MYEDKQEQGRQKVQENEDNQDKGIERKYTEKMNTSKKK